MRFVSYDLIIVWHECKMKNSRANRWLNRTVEDVSHALDALNQLNSNKWLEWNRGKHFSNTIHTKRYHINLSSYLRLFISIDGVRMQISRILCQIFFLSKSFKSLAARVTNFEIFNKVILIWFSFSILLSCPFVCCQLQCNNVSASW